ncbi:MAG: hypothetical protein R3B40_25680 [Polyangiales bacterium]|nr:hypothetical protein [Myxococcales bacterium]MCB9656636.1 hypothetical protein [Sandaracinaceae bacterium]
MKRFLAWVVLALVAGCGGTQEPETSPRTGPAPAYEVHEWGVITATAAGTDVTAGPPREFVQMVVEKPVLYFHTPEALAIQLEVLPGPGFEAREHYPPTRGLHWSARLSPEGCVGQHRYLTDCAAPDGICEVRELSGYETRDGACLEVGGERMPLLFYRLAATRPIALPVAVNVSGDLVRAHATRGEISGFRMALVDGEVRAAAVTLGQTWQPLPTPSESWVHAAEALNVALREAGLTGAERAAFQRAWWRELFGAAPPSASSEPEDAMEEAFPGTEHQEDQEVEQQVPLEEAERMVRGEPVLDVLFYMLPADEVERVAHIAATPAPSRVSRAFLVRHVL